MAETAYERAKGLWSYDSSYLLDRTAQRQAPQQLTPELREEYELYYQGWYVAYRACHGVYGAYHDGAHRAEIEAWNRLVFFCSAHGYSHPPLEELRVQIQAEEAELVAHAHDPSGGAPR